MKMIKKAKKAFTLVELVVVIAIIAILSGVSVAVYVGITDNAKQKAAVSEASSFGTVVRAAVLMDAEGIEVEVDEVKYVATWDSTKGISIEKSDKSTYTEAAVDVEVLKAIFEKVEGQPLHSGAEIIDKDNTACQVNEFTYKVGGKEAVYSFKTGSAK